VILPNLVGVSDGNAVLKRAGFYKGRRDFDIRQHVGSRDNDEIGAGACERTTYLGKLDIVADGETHPKRWQVDDNEIVAP
jgi:hypothetical protein